MPLPKLVTPEFTISVPSTKEPIKIRPFLVKEEKVLFMAMESLALVSRSMDIRSHHSLNLRLIVGEAVPLAHSPSLNSGVPRLAIFRHL